MTMLIAEVYDAFVEAGASEANARTAAEAIAAYENRFTKIEPELAVMKWMLGFNLAVSVVILFKVFI